MAENKDSSPPPSDRRGGERHIACFPAYIEREAGSTHTTMIHDLSVTGALLLGRRALPPVGPPPLLRFYPRGNPPCCGGGGGGGGRGGPGGPAPRGLGAAPPPAN